MVKIGEVISQNPWWKHGEEFTRYDRHLSKARGDRIFFVRKAFGASRENIYIVRGCRQIGKTTYLKEWIRRLIKEGYDPRRILYLSLDFFISRRELRNAMNYFLDVNREAEDLYIFLDEITSIKDWNLELKYLWDSGITKRAKIIATGSSGAALRKKGELLPGRGLEGNEYYMKPLSFREFVLQTVNFILGHGETMEFHDSLQRLKAILQKVSIDLDSDLDKIINEVNVLAPFKRELEYFFRLYLVSGGFPAVINDYLGRKFAAERQLINPNLVENFVRDVLGDIYKQGKQETLARQILREIVNKYGTRYSFSQLASDVESTHGTVMEYLELIEDSFIINVLYPYDFSKKGVKFKGSKKVYFQDPFIFYSLGSYLTGKNVNEVIDETLENEGLLSQIVEGIVCSHLAMNKEVPILQEAKTFLWFYYNTRGKELNSILKTGESYLGIEVKYQSGVSFKDVLKIPEIKKYIILSKEDIGGENNSLMIPVDMFLSLLTKSSHNL